MYQENDWVYVISEENREGFIPHSYCAQYGSQMAALALNVQKKKLPRGGGSSGAGAASDGEKSAATGGGVASPLSSGATAPFGKATSMNGLPTTAGKMSEPRR